MDVSPHTVDVVIDELVLDGVSPDSPEVAQALELALGPALAQRGASASTRPIVDAVTSAATTELRR